MRGYPLGSPEAMNGNPYAMQDALRAQQDEEALAHERWLESMFTDQAREQEQGAFEEFCASHDLDPEDPESDRAWAQEQDDIADYWTGADL